MINDFSKLKEIYSSLSEEEQMQFNDDFEHILQEEIKREQIREIVAQDKENKLKSILSSDEYERIMNFIREE